jgi:hypothetical protein
MAHQRLVVRFGWNGVYLPHLFQNCGHAEFYVTHERFDGCEPTVACDRAIAPLFFDVSEKIQDHCSVDLLNCELSRTGLKAFAGKYEQKPKRVSVGFASAGAASPLDRQVFSQETRD